MWVVIAALIAGLMRWHWSVPLIIAGAVVVINLVWSIPARNAWRDQVGLAPGNVDAIGAGMFITVLLALAAYWAGRGLRRLFASRPAS